MKRLFIATILLTFFMLTGLAFGAGGSNTYTIEWDKPTNGTKAVVIWTWVADDTTAVVPPSSLSAADADLLKLFYVDMGETKPSQRIAPTALYDVKLEDPDGMDVYGGKMEDRSATAGEVALPAIGGALGGRPIYTGLTHRIYNNSVNSAAGVTKITFIK